MNEIIHLSITALKQFQAIKFVSNLYYQFWFLAHY